MADVDDFFARIAARLQALYDRLATLPVAEITGVVGPAGVTAGKRGNAVLWDIDFTFEAWRVGTGAMQSRPLKVLRRGDDEEYRSLQRAIPPDTVIAVAARLDAESSSDGPAALLVEARGPVTTDAELNNRLAEFQKPVLLEDAVFGTLMFNRMVPHFEGRATWVGEPIEVGVWATEPDEVEAALAVAHAVWADQAAWDRKLVERAVRDLLPLKNDCWRDEDEEPLTESEFASRLERWSLDVSPDGSFQFYFADGQIFLGHTIEVRCSVSEGVIEASLAG